MKMSIDNVLPQDVLGCQWNDAEAPRGLRLGVKIMKNWVSFSLSLSNVLTVKHS